jgi:hypothetical protein
MLKCIRTIITAGGAAAALAVALGTAPSSATTATTWTVKPGGSVNAAGTAQVKDPKTGTVAKCKSIKLDGTAKKGSGLPGAKLVTIKSASFTGCTIGTISVKVAVHGLPWYLNATSYTSGVTHGTISGIDLKATATGCSATLDGTAAGKDNGKVAGTYTNSTGVLKLLSTGGNLHAWAVSGCLGLINTGDPAQASGHATVTPRQTITSP